ncbi:PTS family fructose transporter, IIABC component, putative fragment [Alteracholeplasma palmae J233]|uniref:PTS family fructose transporter, IIABC component, putative n=1 Tax=Alteracholeplasma palmae (strain ATCC 49389 / J233) TaxID=1318466 RepID=U4KPK4_ALTPJ|nr:PTS family fructose transporter IIABC component [Alteracholeplasma palmae]CCV64185.1 PTS family fructose transporter, IIABC component, putative fragment [Alteracholeplasma palmae J233]
MKKSIQSALMQGLSYSLIFLVVKGIAICLNQYFPSQFFLEISKYSEMLFYIMFVAFLCYDMADKPGLAIGAITGILIYHYQAGLYGVLLYGILAGYLVKYIKKYLIYLPQELKYLNSILWLPLLSLFILIPGIYFSASYLQQAYSQSVNFFKAIENYKIVLFLIGGILASLMAYDAGGRVNKTTYLIIVLLSGDFPILMTSVIIGGMVPPLVIATYRLIYKNELTVEEEPKIRYQFAMGLSFITEGALPYIRKNEMIRFLLVMSAFFAGALTSVFMIKTLVPHGGILATVTMNKPLIFIIIIVSISLIMSQIIRLLKYIEEKKEVKKV